MLTAHFRQGQTLQRRRAEYEKTWQSIEPETAKHQLPERIALVLFDAALGARFGTPPIGLKVGISDYTAGRDLKAGVDVGLLTPVGERRGRFYVAADALRAIRQSAKGSRRPLDDPFASSEAA